MRPGDRDDYQQERDLDDQERAARRQVISNYLMADADGLGWAVIDREGFNALREIRKVNEILMEHGFQGPLGAAGVSDVFTQMGAAQLHDDELQLVLEMIEAAQRELTGYSSEPYKSVADNLRRAAGEEPGALWPVT